MVCNNKGSTLAGKGGRRSKYLLIFSCSIQLFAGWYEENHGGLHTVGLLCRLATWHTVERQS